MQIQQHVTPTLLDQIYRAIASSYWSQNIPRAVFERAVANSLNFVACEGDTFIAFARVITDKATFAYLCDVWVEPQWRGQGIGKQLIAHVYQHSDLQGLRRHMLMTRDAHELYKQFGFTALASPEKAMEKHNPNVYSGSSS